jgi:transposase
MKRKKHTPAQIVEKLRRADILLGQKSSIAEVVTALEVSELTYYRWRR